MKSLLTPIFMMTMTCAPKESMLVLESKSRILERPQPTKPSQELSLSPGDKIDEFNGVNIFYNGGMNNVSGRNLAKDGYNLGLKYQCVEFVKRYYYYALNHKMPNSWGHAKDFFNPALGDGKLNSERGLIQFKNGSMFKPRVNDILVFNKTSWNPFGHVAIVSKASDESIEIVQQNVGGKDDTREILDLSRFGGKWKVNSDSVRGWLRKE